MAQMIARCPVCGTRFKVVQDQLRISQGWVRCGQCDEVFDAAEQLRNADQPEPDPASEPAATPAPEPALVAAAAATPSIDAAPPSDRPEPASHWLPQSPPEIPISDPVASTDMVLAEFQQARAGVDLQADDIQPLVLHRASADGSGADPATEPEAPPRLVVTLAPQAVVPPVRSVPAAGSMPLPQRRAAEPPPPAPAPARVVAAPPVVRPAPLDPELAELSFLREAAQATVAPAAAPSRARGHQRLLWGVGAALAALALLWQLALHERDRLAASAPGLRPLLAGLCLPFGCQVQPVRRIDAVVIDGSSFVALGESGYRLSMTLRNRAPHEVALPAIMLELKDISEQVVLRRVLLPEEFGTAPPMLAPHSDWTPSIDLQMADNAGRARVVGYHLDAFYP